MGIERRHYKRFKVSFDVSFVIGELEYTGTMSDLSLGGCYILSPAEVELRTQVVIKVRLMAERWLSLRGLIMHHYPKQGFGIRFEFSSDAEEEIIARLVEHLNRSQENKNQA
jgi:c-di-GMP-binding flagellar brake protein YcgR